VRATLADAWLRDALLEHASVASFARFSLELMAVGAPAKLVEQAHAAAMDEVRHARLCFALAGAYAGCELAPAPFGFDGGRVDVSADLAALAARAVQEGCIGETLAALQASEQLGCAVDGVVREVLSIIAEDEARHAELAWRFVRWAISVGGHDVRDAVARAFAEGAPSMTAPPARDPAMSAALAAHGLLDGSLPALLNRAYTEVVLPAARALLAEPSA
jgi:hypothetical protein